VKTTRVLTLTAPEVDRLVELVDELRATGYVHAAEIDARIGKLAEVAAKAGVSVLQIVRQRAPERAGIYLAPGLYGGRDGQIVRERENDASDLGIARFGWGKPVEVRVEKGMEKHEMVERADPEGMDHFFSRDRWEDRNGRELQERGADAIRGAVGPWYPNWFATNVPELLLLGHVAVQGRAVKVLADDEDFRKALDSARRLGGSDAVRVMLDEAGSKES
jgi:hypothetical protein